VRRAPAAAGRPWGRQRWNRGTAAGTATPRTTPATGTATGGMLAASMSGVHTPGGARAPAAEPRGRNARGGTGGAGSPRPGSGTGCMPAARPLPRADMAAGIRPAGPRAAVPALRGGARRGAPALAGRDRAA